MKQVGELMEQIAVAMAKTSCFQDFQAVAAAGDAKKTFLWLDARWRNGDLPEELKPLLTDLFFMLH